MAGTRSLCFNLNGRVREPNRQTACIRVDAAVVYTIAKTLIVLHVRLSLSLSLSLSHTHTPTHTHTHTHAHAHTCTHMHMNTSRGGVILDHYLSVGRSFTTPPKGGSIGRGTTRRTKCHKNFAGRNNSLVFFFRKTGHLSPF
jgi:hypothetical protein